MRRHFFLLSLVLGGLCLHCGGDPPGTDSATASGSGGVGGTGGVGGAGASGGGDVGGTGGVGGAGASGGGDVGGMGGVGGAGASGGGAGGGTEFVSLDPGFGAEGLATTASVPNRDLVHASVRQPDGKLLVVGGTSPGLYGEGLLFRANADGTLDTSFGEGGKVLLSKFGRVAFHDVVVAPNGDIFAAGAITRGRRLHRVLVARFDANGKLVSSFAEGGLALGASGRAFAIALQTDGTILVAGQREEPLPADPPPPFLVQRLLADGSVDGSFGQQGLAEVPLELFPSSVALADDGKIVLCAGIEYSMAVVRLLPSGALDPSFDDDGIFTKSGFPMFYESSWAPSRAPSTCRIAMDGKILVTGRSGGGPLLRLDTSGKPDPTFGGGDGVAALPAGTIAESVQPLPNGSVLVGVHTPSGKAVARFGADGSLDTTYGSAGVAPLPVACLLRDITVDPGGSVLAACRGEFAPEIGVTLAQLTPDGAPDAAYGQGGGLAVLQSGASTDAAFSVRATPDGKIISVGTTSYGSDFANAMVTRHLPDGTLDAGFGAGGVVVLDTFANAMGVGVQPDGKLIVAGETPDPSLRLVVRLDTTGALDASFGLGGIVGLDDPPHGRPRALAVDGLGRIVIGGTRTDVLPLHTPYLARLLGTGEIDPAFGNLGVVDFGSYAGSIEDVLTLPDGRIVGAGAPAPENKSTVVVRVLPSGALDPSFGNGGRVVLNNMFSAGRMVQEVDGGLLLAGLIPRTGDFQAFDVGVARLDTNGARDMTFGTDGLLEVQVEGVVVHDGIPTLDDGPALVSLPDRSFYVATTAHLDRDTIVVFKFLPDGKPDASFGIGGRAVVPAAGAWGAYDGFLQPDGKVVLAGRGFSPQTGTDFGLVRFAP
ncbi:delta-60 repeat domain-containing protein [Polyangium sp. y55x31]|uniref:delta-60 repeat domain-containing protein n=1 Tax=Polyangium sp. y55x31 TaxID=3042688 RepID=UPI002482AAB8|nr:delta-60 repeat domain-containing protein [Polyangium sp. y55x31]MDI1481824.1 delta-60 repeat domain-containing protein [Polyangium sp. y55x31]